MTPELDALAGQDYGDIDWDGLQRSYRPTADWKTRIDPELAISTACDRDLDPITFEVLRNRLWTINVAHGDTLSRMSGSPIFQALDFNMSLLTEFGEIVMSAPFIQYLNTGSPLVAAYIMEKFSTSPGIHEGDVFVANDPWIGASHQMDVCIAMPVFVDGELFAWVSNAAQQYDLGGLVPGGWPQNAVDVYSDPVLFRPFKMIEKGVLRDDLEQMYRRHSRLPDMVALDLRAQLAGCRFAARRLQETCAEFGAASVKAAMLRILDNAQAAFAEKLSRLPDCTLSDVLYFDEKLPGDRTTHRVQFNITKQGDRLIVDNLGTEPQSDGPNGFTYMNFAGIVLGVTGQTLLYEHTFSIGGAQRQIDFRPVPGLLSCCDYPAAVSGGVLNIGSSYERLQNIFARLMANDPQMKQDVVVAGPDCPLTVLAGTTDTGQFFGTAVTAACGFGGGARSYADGVETAGASYDPLIRMPNVEDTEARDPLLILYRKEAGDTGGAGRWRGGVGMEVAVRTYGAGHVEIITNAGGQSVTTNQAMGVFGGHPAPPAYYKVLKSTNIEQVLAGQRIPRSAEDLTIAETLTLRPKSNGTQIEADDVLLLLVCGGGGYGDPLERPAELVAADVANGYVSAAAADVLYGVALAEDGTLDSDATAVHRGRLAQERTTWPTVIEYFGVTNDEPTSPATGEAPRSVQDQLVATDAGGHRVLACGRCDTVLSDVRGDFKFGSVIDQSPLTILPHVPDPRAFLDEDMVFRRYACPGCHTLLTTEIARASEPVLGEVRFL